MLLAIDIGNTSIGIGVFEGERLKTTLRIASRVHQLPDEYAAIIFDILPMKGVRKEDIKDAIICSVVPPLTGVFEELCRTYISKDPLVVRAGIKTGVRIRLENPKEVGSDRIVNALAAHRLYGGPVIVIDMGTAITFDAVSGEGDYLGGAIVPGIAIASEALFMRTAKLPRVEIAKPPGVIGRNTTLAIQAGLFFGYLSLIEGIVERMKREIGGDAKVVATGGYANLFVPETDIIDELDPHLTLKGLRIIYELNRGKR